MNYQLRLHLNRWAFLYAVLGLTFVISMLILFYRP